MKERVFVIIVSFNGGKKVVDCLESIKDWPLIIVDNNSTDKSVELIKELTSSRVNPLINNSLMNNKSTIKLIENRTNLGFAGGVNVGMKYALKNGAEYVMLLNQDAKVEKGTIENLVEVMKGDGKVGICGPLIFDNKKKIWSAGGVVDKKRYSGGHLFKIINGQKPYEIDFISGCAMMIKKKILEKIGFFDERFFLYYEDVDFCFRARKAGFKSVFAPLAIVDHHYHKTADKEKIKEYFMARNHLLFLEKHAPLRMKIREIVRLPKTIYEHLSRGEVHALLGIKDYFFKALNITG